MEENNREEEDQFDYVEVEANTLCSNILTYSSKLYSEDIINPLSSAMYTFQLMYHKFLGSCIFFSLQLYKLTDSSNICNSKSHVY